jgi:hypothetical protein
MMRTLPVGAAFSHSINSTINNLKFAFHVSWPWLIVLFPVSVISNVYFQMNPVERGQMPNPVVGLATFVVIALQIIGFASIAVNWHRFILKDEVPNSFAARLRMDHVVWRYIGNTILLVLRGYGLILLAVLPISFFVFLLGSSKTIAAIGIVIGGLLLLVACIWLIGAMVRWSIKLVGIAVEKPDFRMRDAWAVTENNHWQIFWLYVSFLLVALAIGFLMLGLTLSAVSIGSVAALVVVMAVQTAINWVMTVWGVTLLTSLYGFFVEGREF